MMGVHYPSQTARSKITSVTLALVYSCETITRTQRPSATFTKAATARAAKRRWRLKFTKS